MFEYNYIEKTFIWLMPNYSLAKIFEYNFFSVWLQVYRFGRYTWHFHFKASYLWDKTFKNNEKQKKFDQNLITTDKMPNIWTFSRNVPNYKQHGKSSGNLGHHHISENKIVQNSKMEDY